MNILLSNTSPRSTAPVPPPCEPSTTSRSPSRLASSSPSSAARARANRPPASHGRGGPPHFGYRALQGQDIFARSDEELAVFRRREVGLVYQFYNLIPILDVVENMTLPVRMDGRDVNEKRLKMLLRSLGLTGREHYLPTSSQAASSSVWQSAARS